MKQMKVLGVLAVALTLGLTACGGTKECKTHKWGEWEVVTAETCTTDGLQKRTCTVCKKVEEKKINKGHKWGSWATEEESTCTEQGSEKRTCSRCNEVETRPLDLAPHTYEKDAEGNDVIRWTTEPNCTDAGVGGYRTCTVCQQHIDVSSSEAVALGHNYKKDADGNIEFTWTTAPTCDLPGVGTKHCERCGQDIAATDEERAKLGHDVEAIGGEVTPTDGTAAVRLYHCKRCDQTFMGFLANEVTNDSKAHVKFEPETVTEGQEQGARFLGRPIGNALALDSNGTSVNQQNGEIVYCSTETGDFIEYAFNLNATQAATLATCRLYCDAKPADYLNGTDFWAYGASNDEWTPGYYIDGGPERFQTNDDGTPKMVKDHAKAGFDGQPGAELETEVQIGKRIEDYRYVLYVDGNVVDFDPDTKNPTQGTNTSMQRGEFELPYTFHLHEGLNKIKFVMAGGYRSLFYKCIFRPYEEPTQITVNQTELNLVVGETANITSTFEGLTYASSKESVATVDANGVVTAVKAGEAEITVSKDGNYKPAKVKVTVVSQEHVHTWGNATAVATKGEGYVGYRVSRCASDDADKIAIRALDGSFVGTSKNKSGTREGYLKLNGNGDSITYKFDYKGEETKALIYQFGFMDGWNDNKSKNYTTIQNGQSVGPSGCNFGVNFNEEEVQVSADLKATSFEDLLANATVDAGSGNSKAGPCLIGEVTLKNGDNEFTFKRYASYNLAVSDFEIVIPAHKHTWGEDTPVTAKGEGYVGYKTATCTEYGEATRIAIRALDGSFVGTSKNKSGTPDGYLKLNGNGDSITYKFDYQGTETKALIYQVGFMDGWSSNSGKNYTSKQSGQTLGPTGCNFGVNFNDEEVQISDELKETSFADLLKDATVDAGDNNSKAGPCLIGEVTLKNGDNVFTFKRYASYNLAVSDFYIVF